MYRIHHPKLKERRDRMRAEGLCINGPAPWTPSPRPRHVEHGPVVAGGRCQRCIEIKRRSH